MSTSDRLRLVGPLERVLFLRALEPLAVMRARDLAVLAEHARERSFRAGDVLLRAGEPVCHFHILVDGAVRARGSEYLQEQDLGPRESLGFLSLFAGRKEGVHAVATEDTTTLEFEDEVFFDILEENFEITAYLIRRLASDTLVARREIPSGSYLAPMKGEFQVPVGRPLDLVERILLLRRPGSPFKGASLDAITQVARATPQVSYPEGTTLWKNGDRSDHALIVLSGTVVCTTQWGISRFRAGPGYPLGNLERFSRDPRWYTAVTETPVVALRGETETLLDVFEDHFDMSLGFVRAMAKRLIALREENAEISLPVPAAG